VTPVRRVVLVALLWAAVAGAGFSGQPTERVGKSFLFDYGEMVIRVKYLSDSRLAWEQVKGPQAGLQAEEEYGFAAVRPGVGFFWWQEKDGSVVTQVVDFERGRVYTTWTAKEQKPASFQGSVRPIAP
jgi:hypothetical protein